MQYSCPTWNLDLRIYQFQGRGWGGRQGSRWDAAVGCSQSDVDCKKFHLTNKPDLYHKCVTGGSINKWRGLCRVKKNCGESISCNVRTGFGAQLKETVKENVRQSSYLWTLTGYFLILGIIQFGGKQYFHHVFEKSSCHVTERGRFNEIRRLVFVWKGCGAEENRAGVEMKWWTVSEVSETGGRHIGGFIRLFSLLWHVCEIFSG